MKIRVEFYLKRSEVEKGDEPVLAYDMDYDNKFARDILDGQMRKSFEGGHCVVTYPVEA